MTNAASKLIDKSVKCAGLDKNTFYRGAVASVCVLYACSTVLPYVYNKFNEIQCTASKSSVSSDQTMVNEELTDKPNPALNKEFFSQLSKILKIIIPGIRSKSASILILHTATLVARTFLSIRVAKLEGQVVKFIVQKNGIKFALMMAKWLTIAIPATFVNSLIRYLESHLALSFRSKLVKYAYELYFKNQCYYRISNLDGRIENADHCITEDVSAFSSSIAHLYSHLTKPILDVLLITYSLKKLAQERRGNSVPGHVLGTFIIVITGQILRAVSPKFGKLVADEAEKKGYLRAVHSRIVTNAEEIAFYGGHKIELAILNKGYQSLINQMKIILNKRLWYIMLEQFLMKYVWSGVGMVMLAIPLFTSKSFGTPIENQNSTVNSNHEDGVSSRTEYFTTARNLLQSAADAFERLMLSYKEIVELAGYTARVGNMLQVFEEVQNEKYEKFGISNRRKEHHSVNIQSNIRSNRFSAIRGHVIDSTDGSIRIENVPIVTPNYDVIVPSISITVTNDMHLLITGPNGCGKSSLFRIISGLWPVYGGSLRKPMSREMFYIPQRPYMIVGTFREQIIYPDSKEDMIRRGFTDKHLLEILTLVHLTQILTREGGWDIVQDWKDVLSGGEKQRVGMARLFYHKPRFALLDECTSAVSIDVEGEIYDAIKQHGISLLTITHRPSLWKFHTHILQFDGEGGWTLDLLDSEKRLSLEDEKIHLENFLKTIPGKMERLKELCQALGESSTVESDLNVVWNTPELNAENEHDSAAG